MFFLDVEENFEVQVSNEVAMTNECHKKSDGQGKRGERDDKKGFRKYVKHLFD